jgi:hypothetical protein
MENPSFSQQWKLVSSSANYWIIFCPPLLITVFITWLILDQIYPYDINLTASRDDVLVTKNVLEEIAFYVTSGFCFLCLLRYLYSKDKFFLWASGMMMVLFFRELHPPISSVGVYVLLLMLFYIAYKKHHIFADYIRNKYLVTLLGVGFFTYVLAVTTDERVWMFVPGEMIFHTKLEETLEVLGHISIGFALLFATRKMSENSY